MHSAPLILSLSTKLSSFPNCINLPVDFWDEDARLRFNPFAVVKFMNIRFVRRPIFGTLALLSAFNIFGADSYTLVDLGLGAAKDINSSGKVVGNADAGGWYYDGSQRKTLKFGTHFLGTPADQLIFYTAISANAINDDGRMVGSIIFIPLQPQTQTPYFFDGGDAATLLFANGDAYGVNSGGTVVGGSGTGFLFDTSKVIDKGSATLNAVNDSGLAAGSVPSGGLDQAASFNGSNQTLLDLQGLNLPAAGPGHDYESTALSVNNAGRIVGQVQLTGSNPRPTWGFLWKQGSASSLGDLGGSITSPHDINNSGRVVGTATISDDSPHAFDVTSPN